MNAANQRRLTPVLAGVALALTAAWLVLLSGVGQGVHWAAPRDLPALPPAMAAGDQPVPLPLQQFAAVWERPLFSPERRPVVRAVEGGGSLGDLQLTGIILTPSLRMAMLHDRNGERQVRLREGQALPDGSVTLVEVRPRSAVFDAASGRTELKLPAGAPLARPASSASDEAPMPPPPPPPENASGAGHAAPQPVAPMAPNSPPPAANEPTQRELQALREAVQKRRAARAAEAHQGVR